MNSLVTGLARHGAQIAPGTLAGACAQAGALLAPLEDAITERSRGSWHLHADETTWRVFAPRDGDGRRNGGYGCSWARTRLLRDGRHEVRDGASPARASTGPRTPGSSPRMRTAGRGSWSMSATSMPFTSPPGRRRTAWSIFTAWLTSEIFGKGRRREPRPARGTRPARGWSKSGPVAHTRISDRVAGRRGTRAAGRRRRGRPTEGSTGTAWDDALAVIDTARKKQMAAPEAETREEGIAALDRKSTAGRPPPVPDAQPG